MAERPGVSGEGAGRPVKTLRLTLRPCLAESISHSYRVFYFRSQSGNLAMLAAMRRASSLVSNLAAERLPELVRLIHRKQQLTH